MLTEESAIISLKLRLWMENSNMEVKEQEDNTQIRSFTCALFEELYSLVLLNGPLTIGSFGLVSTNY